MQKYGIQRQHVHGYPDINIPGCEPWWADNHNGKSKKRARRIAKNEIMAEICENNMPEFMSCGGGRGGSKGGKGGKGK